MLNDRTLKLFYACFIFFVISDTTFAGTAINGFISQGYLKTDKNNFNAGTEDGSFEFNEMGIKFSSSVSNNLFLGMQLFARDLGNLGNDEITLDWAYADYIVTNSLGIRAGLLKIPYGLYNESRDSDMMRASIFLPSGIYSETWRDSLVTMKGVGLYGTIYDYFSYQIQTGGNEIPLDGGLAKQFMGLVSGETQSFTTENFTVASIQLSEIVAGLRFCVGYYYWKFNLDVNLNSLGITAYSEGDINTWIASGEYTISRFVFASEFSIFKYDAPFEVPGIPPGIIPDPSTETQFFYVSMSYQITDALTIGTNYLEAYGDRDDRDGKKWVENFPWLPAHTSYEKTNSFFARYDINTNWVVKFEWQYHEGTASAYVADNRDENGNVDLAKYWNLWATKVMFVF